MYVLLITLLISLTIPRHFFFLPSGAMNDTNSHEGLHSMSVPGQSAELTACEELKRKECLNKQLISFCLSPSVSLLSQQGNSGIVSMATVRGPGQTTAPGPKPQPI